MSEQQSNGKRWATWVAIGVGAAGLLAGGLIAWGDLSSDMEHAQADSVKLEKRVKAAEMLQFQDGRDLTALKASVDAIREDVQDIKRILERIDRRRRPRWTRGRDGSP